MSKFIKNHLNYNKSVFYLRLRRDKVILANLTVIYGKTTQSRKIHFDKLNNIITTIISFDSFIKIIMSQLITSSVVFNKMISSKLNLKY